MQGALRFIRDFESWPKIAADKAEIQQVWDMEQNCGVLTDAPGFFPISNPHQYALEARIGQLQIRASANYFRQ